MTNNTTGSNVAFSREQFEKDVADFGRSYGQGFNARPSFFLRALEGATKSSEFGPDKAKDDWTIFQKNAAEVRGVEYQAEASFDVQVSKARQAYLMGNLPGRDPVDTMNRALDILKSMQAQEDSPVKGSAYDNMVSIARAQIATPDHDLTDEEIASTFTKVTEEKTLLDKTVDAYRRLYKLRADFAEAKIDDQHIAASLEKCGDAIKAMDGELPPVTKEQKAKANIIARAKKLGLDVTSSVVGMVETGLDTLPVQESVLIPAA